MSCSRGKANPNANTKLRLFASSGGYCQNPTCTQPLFYDEDFTSYHIAEMAHIISAGISGPRTENITEEEKGDFDNLILLCPTCHTKIDKAESDYPADKIIEWKNNHQERIRKIFNIVKVESRKQARKLIIHNIDENKAIFELYGPNLEESKNPEFENHGIWTQKILSIILPNNRKIVDTIVVNYSLLNSDEVATFNIFKQHVIDFENRHLNSSCIDGIQYPIKMNDIFL
ncbi:HNH endonuclease [Chryseobacterium wangxinyae]|uniref:HNH endonuclease n=1 Tax=Chryseobacterium sp. CY353 TaxID=2997334 RepID=UPI00226E9C98|nr:hypothetical protein [Chryseobacterium sp. CY353]MCY0967968.1 hypothetical protein [Chryseobacterium sp. CY353]